MSSAYSLVLTNDANGQHVLWLTQNRAYGHVSLGDYMRAKAEWIEWIESLPLKGSVNRCLTDFGGVRNIMIFSDLSDVMLVKLFFKSEMFEYNS